MKQLLNRSILALVVVLVVYNALAFGGVRLMDQAVSMVLMAVALICFTVRMFLVRERTLFGGVSGFLILCFLGYALVRHLYTETEYASRHELIDVTLGVTTFFLVINAVGRPRDVSWIIGVLLVVGAGLSLYAAYQYFSHSDQVWTSSRPAGYSGRGSGTFINPNHLAGFLELILPLGLALTLSARASWTMRIIWGYCVLVIIAGIVLTFSRGGWLAAAVGLGAIILWTTFARRRSIAWVAVVCVVVAILGMLVSSTLLIRLRLAVTGKEMEAVHKSTRLLIWRAAVEAWKTNPWWGIGANQFQYRYYAYRDLWLQTNPVRVHNDYLNTLCEYGAVGFGLASLAVFSLLTSAGWRLYRAREIGASDPTSEGDRLNLLAGALAAALALVIHSLVDFNLHMRANLLLSAFILGLVARFNWAVTEQTRIDPDGSKSGWWGTIRVGTGFLLVLCLIAGLGWQFPRVTAEGMALRKFAVADWGSSDALNALLQAAAAEPRNPETLMKLGDHHRQLSSLGEDNFETLAREAMVWYERAMKATPASPWPPMRYGTCLHWLDRHEEALPYFERMIALDPNSQHTRAMMGWHYYQIEDYDRSREWFNKSRNTPHFNDPVTLSYEILLKNMKR